MSEEQVSHCTARGAEADLAVSVSQYIPTDMSTSMLTNQAEQNVPALCLSLLPHDKLILVSETCTDLLTLLNERPEVWGVHQSRRLYLSHGRYQLPWAQWPVEMDQVVVKGSTDAKCSSGVFALAVAPPIRVFSWSSNRTVVVDPSLVVCATQDPLRELTSWKAAPEEPLSLSHSRQMDCSGWTAVDIDTESARVACACASAS